MQTTTKNPGSSSVAKTPQRTVPGQIAEDLVLDVAGEGEHLCRSGGEGLLLVLWAVPAECSSWAGREGGGGAEGAGAG